MTDWEKIRSEFPALKNHTYLMTAAAGPLHPAAYRRSLKFMQDLLEHGDTAWDSFEADLSSTRKDIARFLNVEPEEISFVSSTSMAMNIFALHLKNYLKKDSLKTLSPDGEFPSTTLPWKKHGYELCWISADTTGAYNNSEIKTQIEKEKPDILLSSHIQYARGYRHDLNGLSKIAFDAGIISVVNATQSLGAFKIDASKIEFLCASVHKWLNAGYGLSVVKISKKYLDKPLPLHGWLSEIDPWTMQNKEIHPRLQASSLELGCGPLQSIFSVGAMIKWIDEIGGIEKISERILSITNLAKEKLKNAKIPLAFNFSNEYQSGILILKTKESPQTVEAMLAKKNIFVNARSTGLRIALHYYNNEKDIDDLINALSTL